MATNRITLATRPSTNIQSSYRANAAGSRIDRRKQANVGRMCRWESILISSLIGLLEVHKYGMLFRLYFGFCNGNKTLLKMDAL